MVTLTIDNRTVTVPEGTTILEAARSARLDIPTLCYLKDINEIGACRICMVEVEGEQRLVAACDTQVAEGIVVHTNSPRVREARRVNLRLLLAHCGMDPALADGCAHMAATKVYAVALDEITAKRSAPAAAE